MRDENDVGAEKVLAISSEILRYFISDAFDDL